MVIISLEISIGSSVKLGLMVRVLSSLLGLNIKFSIIRSVYGLE